MLVSFRLLLTHRTSSVGFSWADCRFGRWVRFFLWQVVAHLGARGLVVRCQWSVVRLLRWVLLRLGFHLRLGWGDAGAEGLSWVFFVLLFILVLAVFL